MNLSLPARFKVNTAPRLVMLVGDEGAILVHYDKGQIIKRLFAPGVDAQFTKPMAALLESVPNLPLYLLVDTVDQSYVRHDLPPVNRLNIGKLIQRRLERDFAADDIKKGLCLGKEKTGRCDWNYLLIGLALTPNLRAWLDFVLEQPVNFAGIYALPVEAQPIIRKLILSFSDRENPDYSGWHLLVSHNKVGGFRQVVLKDNRLLFTRLAQPMGDTVPEVIAGNIEQEVLNTIEYLKRLALPGTDQLNLYIIASQDVKNAVDGARFGARATHIMTPHEAAIRLEMEQAALPGDHFGDIVLAMSFASEARPVLKFSTPYSEKLTRMQRYIAGVKWSAAAIVLAMAAYGASCIGSVFDASSGINDLEKEKLRFSQELAVVEQEAKSLPVALDRINELTDLYKTLSREERIPNSFVDDFHSVLAGQVLVRRWEWTANDPSAASSGQAFDPLTIRMEVEFNADVADIDAFVSTTNAFIDRLKLKFSEYEVEYSKIPGIVGKDEALEFDFSKPGANAATSQDKLVTAEITMRGPHAPGLPSPPPPPAQGQP